MMCPGQDTRYWKPDDIFEVLCQACDTPIEFFKTDTFRRCPKCGKRIQNPKVSIGCAQWCAYAKECLGFDPKEIQLADSNELSLLDRLVEAVKKEFGDNQEHITHSLLVLDRAQDIMRREGGDPRVIMAAALLHDIGIPAAEYKHDSSEPRYQEVEGAVITRRILQEIDMDETTIDHICRIVMNHHSDQDVDSTEFKIIWDADRLEEVPDGFLQQSKDRLEAIIERVFKTETGRLKAHKLFIEERI